MSIENRRRPTTSTIDILRKLVGFQTVSRNSNLDLIKWVEAYLGRHGVTCHLSHSENYKKANLFATIGQGDGGIVLSGHTDVVPVDGQDWYSDPFELREQDGKFFGRGTCDMKGFIAVVLAKIPDLVSARLPYPLHIALSYDEEIGCLGVRHLLDDLVRHNVKPRGCIIGEPTSMNGVVGHKSGTAYVCEVTGLEVHSSLAPQGVNAVEYAARMIVKIRDIAQRLLREEKRHTGYEVPYSTLQTGVVEGGHASNIVPRTCVFRFDLRTLPWTNAEDLIGELNAFAQDELIPEMRAVAPHADITITQKGCVPGFSIAEDAPLTRYVQRLTKSNTPPGYVTFGSEAGLFQQINIPAVICGPGSISQAHKPDEFVPLDQLVLCEDFIDRLANTPFS